MLVLCDYCEREFRRPASHVARVKRVFCSKACFDEYQKERLIKQCKFCHSDFEVRLCESHKFSTCENAECRRKNKAGKNNPNWRGGTTEGRKLVCASKKYRAWRTAVFERDDYTCQFCGKRGGKLNADHIKPWAYFPELRYELSNGRTLCLPCHKTTYKLVYQYRKLKDKMQRGKKRLWVGQGSIWIAR